MESKKPTQKEFLLYRNRKLQMTIKAGCANASRECKNKTASNKYAGTRVTGKPAGHGHLATRDSAGPQRLPVEVPLFLVYRAEDEIIDPRGVVPSLTGSVGETGGTSENLPLSCDSSISGGLVAGK